MSILNDVFGGEVATVGDVVQKVISMFKLSPEAALEFQKQMEEHKFELEKMTLDVEARLQEVASQNIQAEEKSPDRYTSRARPTFLYMMELILGWNYIIVPLLRQTPVALPDALFWLFGSCMLGYTGARTWEKLAGAAGK